MIFTFTGSTITFLEAPREGDGFVRDRQRYMFVGSRPVMRSNGQPSLVITWRTECVDCGAPFQVTTGVVKVKPPTRRCVDHRCAFKPATPAAEKRMRKGQSVFYRDRARS